MGARIEDKLRGIVGPDMKLNLRHGDIGELEERSKGKFKVVTSILPIEELLYLE